MNKIEKLDINYIADKEANRICVDMAIAIKLNELIDSHNSEAEEVEALNITCTNKRADACGKCGHGLVVMHNFCPNCGVKIKWNI